METTQRRFKKHQTIMVVSGNFKGRTGQIWNWEEVEGTLLYLVKMVDKYFKFVESQMVEISREAFEKKRQEAANKQ